MREVDLAMSESGEFWEGMLLSTERFTFSMWPFSLWKWEYSLWTLLRWNSMVTLGLYCL